MDHFRLESFKLEDAGRRNCVILVNGDRIYKHILDRAFTNHFFSRTFDDRYGRFQWGTYIYDVDENVTSELAHLLDLTQQHLYLDDDLTECFALDYHTVFEPSGGYLRSTLGQLVYEAKPYKRTPTLQNQQAASQLAEKMISFISNHPTYRRSQVVIVAPPSQTKPFDLPYELASHVLTAFPQMEDGRKWVTKLRQTRPMKDCLTIPDKINNVRQAFGIAPQADLVEKDVLLIDDIYQSGYTINEIAHTLFAANAKSVFGLVATKTGRDL